MTQMTLEHRAFLYRGVEDFLRVTEPFLRAGARAGEAIVAVVREPGLSALRDSLSDLKGQVDFYDSDAFYRHPVRTLKQYHELVKAMAPRRVRALAEPVWHGWDAREAVEWARYESLINVVFGGVDALALCPYDRASLPEAVLDQARRTHPLLLDDGAAVRSDRYVDPAVFGDDASVDQVAPYEAAYTWSTGASAAGDFEARFTYLIRQLGAEAEDIGVHMRGSAFAYEESDAMVAASMDDLGGMLH